MTLRRITWLGLALWLLSLAFVALTLLLLVLNRSHANVIRAGTALDVDLAVALTFPTVGAWIAVHRPTNAIGWIFCAIGLFQGAATFGYQYALYALLTNPGVLPAGQLAVWISAWAWAPGVGLTGTFLLLLFPTGRLPSARWQPVAWCAVVGITLIVVALMLAPADLLELPPPIDNPLAIQCGRTCLEGIWLTGLMLWGISAVAAVASLVLRLRRSRGEERQQLKWFVYTGLLTVGTYLSALLLGNPPIFEVLEVLVVPLLPLAVSLAILRYRLYDIDVIIRRTLVYSVLTLTLGLVYLGCILVTRTLVAPLTGSSDLAIVISTLAIAALFTPLRRRIQNLIDKHFYRRKYDAAKVLAAFGATVRDETDLDALTTEMLRVVDDTMQPEFVGLWLKPMEGVKRDI
jgi:hypothetical protein